MTRDNIVSVFFGALLLFILYSTLLILSPFAHPIFWSAMTAFGFYPFYQQVLKRVGKRREIAALLTTVLIFLIFAPVILVIVTSLIREISNVYEWVMASVQAGGIDTMMDKINSIAWVEKIRDSDFFQTSIIHESLKKIALNLAEVSARFAVHQATVFTRNVFMAGIDFFLMTFLVFFFLKDGDTIYQFIYKITPLDAKTKRLVFTQLTDTFSAVLRGQIVTALVQAALAGIIYWILGIPLPLFFAGLTFLAALIPVVGAATIWVPITVYLLVMRDYTRASVMFATGVLVISLVDNILKPLLIGEKTKLPYLLLFLGILGGLQIYGLMGIFLAPAVLSLFFVLITIYQEKIFAEKN